MAELLFIATTIFVAYVVFVAIGKKEPPIADKPAEKPAAAPQAPVAVKAEPAAAPAVAETKATPKPAPKTKTTATKAKAAAAKPAPAAPASSTPADSLKNPKTGEIAKLPGNYAFAKRWIKDALVEEGLLDKVYKNNELNADTTAKIQDALQQLKALDKYR